MTNYRAVDIFKLRNSTKDIRFDLYIKLSEDNYAHVFSRATGLDYKRLAQYIHKDVKELYIREEDTEAFNAFVSCSADSIFQDPATPIEKKIAVLLNMTEQNMAELFTDLNVPEETAQNTGKVVKNYVRLMTETPKTLAVLLKLVAHGEYLYYHSIAVSIFSLLVAKASGQFNTEMLELVGMGGFLHDIGYSQLPKELLNSPDQLTEEQREVIQSHPRMGLQMIEKTPNIPDEVRYMVYQHHEEPGGGGYPNGLKDSAIYYPARIISLVDSFSSLISKRPFRVARAPEEAIRILQSDRNKYDGNLAEILASIFLRNSSSDRDEAA